MQRPIKDTMKYVNPMCVCGHPMHEHCGDGCFVYVDADRHVFCACRASGGQYDPEADGNS